MDKKTTVDDIIGIVHTDETTNSVEEVKKLRGRTNERFELVDIGFVYDNDKLIGMKEIVDLLNQLNDENEQLKQNCKNYEWYKQYKTVLNENEQLKRQVKEYSMRNTVNSDLYDETYEQLEKMEKNYKSLLNENEQLKADKQALIDFIKKEFPKSHKHILEGFE